MNFGERVVLEVPAGFDTETTTEPAAWDLVVAVIVAAFVITNEAAVVVPNLTEVALVKCVPVIFTVVPPALGPLLGVREVTVGRVACVVGFQLTLTIGKPVVSVVTTVVVPVE